MIAMAVANNVTKHVMNVITGLHCNPVPSRTPADVPKYTGQGKGQGDKAQQQPTTR